MPEQATVYQGVYLGPETTPGTAVPAIVKLATADIDIMPAVVRKARRSPGHKFATGVSRGKEMSTARVAGDAGYFDLAYLLESCIGISTKSVITAAKTWKWTWLPDPGCSDNYQTYTVEKGCGNIGARMPFGVISGLALRMTDSEVTLSGDAFGGIIQDAFTITTPTQDLPDIPIDPDSINVYMGTSSTNFVQLLRCTEATWTVGTRRAGKKTINREVRSFSFVIELAFQNTIQLTVELDAAGEAMMADLRANNKVWFKLDAIGPQIPDDTSKTYTLNIISPVRYMNTDRGDKNDMYGSTFDLEPMIDSVFGSGMKIEMTLPIDLVTNTTRLGVVYGLSGGGLIY